MRKPTPKRLGLLRMARDFSNEQEGVPFYPWNFSWIRLGNYNLGDEDINVIHAAVRAGLLRVHKEHFYFLTEAGRAVLEKYKCYLPEIPAQSGRPKINRIDSTTKAGE